MIIQIESIPVHFWRNSDGFMYWAETGYHSDRFSTLGEAIAAAKSEIQQLVAEFGSLPLFPVWINNSWLEISEEF